MYNSGMPKGLETLEPLPDEPAPCEQVTRLLNAASAGDSTAPQKLYDLVYNQLRVIAQHRMAAVRPGHTLQATALVNEACIRLLGKPGAVWAGRQHFFHAAAQAMRQVLIDHFRKQRAEKRGGGRAALSITSVADLASTADPAGFLALDEAILRLEKVDTLAASVVHLRFYGGLQPAEVADTLGVSERTARRAWVFARGWLRDALEQDVG
jgi:RNA polymerase sigma factor (TIGR02999 family)